MYFNCKIDYNENYIIDTYTNSAYITTKPDILKYCREIRLGLQKDTVVSVINGNEYKIAHMGRYYNVRVRKINREKLIKSIHEGKVLNAEYNNGDIQIQGAYEIINTEKEFKQSISKQNKVYKAKAKLLGVSGELEYIIEGTNVMLTGYSGTDKRLVIPEFITAIQREALSYKKIQHIVLPDSLKYIGDGAFRENNLETLDIPGGVVVLSPYSLDGNVKLTEDLRNNLRVLSKDTIVMEQQIHIFKTIWESRYGHRREI